MDSGLSILSGVISEYSQVRPRSFTPRPHTPEPRPANDQPEEENRGEETDNEVRHENKLKLLPNSQIIFCHLKQSVAARCSCKINPLQILNCAGTVFAPAQAAGSHLKMLLIR